MKPEAFIASRIFTLSKKHMSSNVMRLALVSVALGISVMIVSVSIVIGFKNQIREKVIGFVAPIQIKLLDNNESIENTALTFSQDLNDSLKKISAIDHIQLVAYKAGIVKTDDQIQGIVFKGVDNNFSWPFFQSKLISGRIPDFQQGSRSNEVIISSYIANKLLLKTGDALRVWFVDTDQQARGRRFDITGIYETGLFEFDERYVLGDLEQIRKLNNWNDEDAGAVEVWLNDKAPVDQVNNQIYFSLPVNMASYTADELYPHIFDWLSLQDMNVIIIIILMVLVSGITMISMLLIIILERTAMIGLLKTMGASNRFVQRIFLVHSSRILLTGLIMGNIIGIGICLLQQTTGIAKLPAESYYLSTVPIDLSFLSILLINAGTLLLWFLMLLIPTSLINRIVPARSIKFA